MKCFDITPEEQCLEYRRAFDALVGKYDAASIRQRHIILRDWARHCERNGIRLT